MRGVYRPAYFKEAHMYKFDYTQQLLKRPTPCRLLLLGILRQAILDYLNVYSKIRDKKNILLINELEEWFTSKKKDQQHYFSFLDLCEYLDLDANNIWAHVVKMRKNKTSINQFRGKRLYNVAAKSMA